MRFPPGRWLPINLTPSSQIQTQRRKLLARRWLPGCPAVKKEAQDLWLAKDSGSKFKTMLDILGDLQKWFENKGTKEKGSKGDETVAGGPVAAENIQKVGTNPSGGVESMT
jgi:hypothetical protein